MEIDFGKTWDELENVETEEPDYKTSLTILGYKLSKIPLIHWKPEELTRMLHQKFSPHLLVPLALIHLRKEPLANSMGYRGDMLEGVLNMPHSYFEANPRIYAEVENIVNDVMARCLQAELTILIEAIESFKSSK